MEAGNWLGNIWGTYKGLSFLEISKDEDTKLTLRVNVNGDLILLHGVVDFAGVPRATLRSPAGSPKEVEATFIFERITDDSLGGRWSQSDGNAGIFSYSRQVAEQPPAATPTAVLEVMQQTVQFPKITIYRDEIIQLISAMKLLLPTVNDVVVHIIRGQIDNKRLAGDFWADPALPERVELLELSLTEANPPGIVKTINLVLAPQGCSLSVSGGDRVLVAGAVSQLQDLLKRYHSGWRRIYEKHGLNANGLLALLVIILLPSLDLLSRFVFVVIAALFVFSFKFLHSWTTQLRIFLKTEREKVRFVDRTDFMTTVLGAALLAAIPYVYTWLKGEGLTAALSWLSSLAARGSS